MTLTRTKSPPRSTSSLWRRISEKGRAIMLTMAKIKDQTPPFGKNEMMITKSKKNDAKFIAAA